MSEQTAVENATPAKTAAKKAAKKVVKKATKAVKKIVEKASKGSRGRTCQFAGMKLYKKATENPRREGTHGFNSFKLIKDGMSYEQYIAKGGRLVDLVWDVNAKNVIVKK